MLRRTQVLATDDRALLVNLLAPPEQGFQLERAVGTTFTLQLESLLRIPLAIVGAEWSASADRLGVMAAVRSSADRIDLFCQAGLVGVPRAPNPLLALLESLVHPVRRPSPGRHFHPKIWLVSFLNDSGERRFRFLCGSRNLTADRSWDVVISLDGVQTKRRNPVNSPLSDFVASLPGRAPTSLPLERVAGIEALAEHARFAEWEPPAGATPNDWLKFHVFGAVQSGAPNFDGVRRVIISPFLDEQGVDLVWPEGSECTIVSRAESFAALSDKYREQLVSDFGGSLLVLDDGAAVPDEDDADIGPRWSMRGLHAKAYIVERNKQAHVFIGSANATGAGFSGNDELLVEIVGRPALMGVRATMADTVGGLSKLLIPYDGAGSETDTDLTLQWQVDQAIIDLAELEYCAIANPAEDSWTERVSIVGRFPELPENASLSIRLITGPDERSIEPTGGLDDPEWAGLQAEDVTSLLVLRLEAGPKTNRVVATCVVVADLIGEPADRLDRLLAKQVGTTDAFLRHLMILVQLGQGDGSFAEAFSEAEFGATSDEATEEGSVGATDRRSTRSWRTHAGVLESLIAILSDHPQTIDEIDRLVTRLQATEQGQSLLPPNWNEIWPQVIKARQQLGRRRP